MRSVPIVMIGERGQHALEVPRIQNEQPIEALSANGSHEPFRDPVRLGRLNRRPNDSNAGALKDGVEARRELAIVIADQHPHRLSALGERPGDLPRLLRDSGVMPVVLPAWSPNLNAFAERFVESAKSECLDRMVLLGEGHLRAAVREFVHHYHEERPHQGLYNELIAPTTTVIGTGQLKCRERLGGLLKFYYREAA